MDVFFVSESAPVEASNTQVVKATEDSIIPVKVSSKKRGRKKKTKEHKKALPPCNDPTLTVRVSSLPHIEMR